VGKRGGHHGSRSYFEVGVNYITRKGKKKKRFTFEGLLNNLLEGKKEGVPLSDRTSPGKP